MKALRKYLEKIEKAIVRLLEMDRQSYDSGTVHAIRIEIKKMNAFLHLINFTVPDFPRNRVYKPFKVIFRQAGRLRELQVEEAMLKKYAFKSLPADYKKALKKRRLQEQKEFYSILKSKHVRRLKKACRKIHPFIEDIGKKKVNEFLKKKQKQIEKNVTKNSIEISELHKLRKRLKEYEYNRTSAGFKEPKIRSVKANTLPILLGKWHDCQVMIRHLEKVTRDRQKYPGEVILLNRISNKVSEDRDALLVKIEKALLASEFNRK